MATRRDRCRPDHRKPVNNVHHHPSVTVIDPNVAWINADSGMDLP
jgi:hypothetical protein